MNNKILAALFIYLDNSFGLKRLLVSGRITVNSTVGNQPIVLLAAKRKKLCCLYVLLEKGANLNLMYKGKKIVTYLLESSIEVRAVLGCFHPEIKYKKGRIW